MIISILFPDIKAEFDLSDTQMGWLGGPAFAIFYATLGLPVGRLADQYSRKKIIIASLVTFSVMTLLCGWAVGFFSLLLFRIGVGIGEAGVNPASHSIIADYFPPTRRAFAMAILMMGANFGIMLGSAGGGFIAQSFGWRAAMIAVGAPGLLIALLMLLYFREPPRGAFEEKSRDIAVPSVLNTFAGMWSNAIMRHLLMSSSIMGLVGYGLMLWLPTFFSRTHALTQSQTGLVMAVVFGILGVAGALVSGKIADRLSRKGFYRTLNFLAAAQLVTIPFLALALLTDNFTIAIALFIIPAFTGNFYMGPTLALVQTLSPVNRRAVASAVLMLCINLFGLGLGPLAVGTLSDYLTLGYGEKNALSIALVCLAGFSLWAALHFYLCARVLKKQAARGANVNPAHHGAAA